MCNVKASCSDLWLFSYYRGNNWFSLRLNKANIAISHQAQRKLNLCNSFCWNVFLFRVSSLIMDAVISTFRKILYTSDVMDALKVNTWLSREHTLTMKKGKCPGWLLQVILPKFHVMLAMPVIIQANWLKDSTDQNKTSNFREKVQDYKDRSRRHFIKCDFVTGF